MQELLRRQRIGGRGVEKKRRGAGGKRRRRGYVLDAHRTGRRAGRTRDRGRANLFSGAARLIKQFFKRNRYGLVTASSLVSLLATAVVFSAALQQTLPAPPAAPGPQAKSAAAPAGPDLAPPDVSIQALSTAYDELGAGVGTGTRTLVRDRDVEYVMEEGDTLYSIGKLYVISPSDLREYNRITDPNRLRVGSTIVIPSISSLAKFKTAQEKLRLAARRIAPASRQRPATILPEDVRISARAEKSGLLLNASFSVDTALPEEGVSYFWEMGDGAVSRRRNPSYSYLNPGVYSVSLKVRDKFGYELKANTVTLEVTGGENANLIRTMYVTVGAVGEVFALAGQVSQIDDYLGRPEKAVQLVEERDGSFFYRALLPGNFSLIARGGEIVYKIYLFVSPFPSVHADRFDIDWYRTQYNTGSSNCGPASVSMAIGWAKGDFVSVSAIRRFLGFQGDGGTSFAQLERALAWKGVKTSLADISSVEDLFAVIDRGDIAVVLFHTGRISKTRGRPEYDYVGRYYSESVGHYAIVKGYSADKKYIIVYDPLPSDWVANGTRYGDGISMLGRNRYYPAADLARALSLYKVLVISR